MAATCADGEADVMTKRASLPLSALLLALVAALTLGTVSSATAAGLTKSTVRKIAAKVVDKKASALSVAHAKTADSATSAATAANATQLAGAPASTYLDRAAHENLTSNTGLSANIIAQVNNPTPINVPAGVKFLHITGAATFTGGNTDVQYWPMVDATCSPTTAGYDHRGSGNTSAGQVTVPVDFLAPVTAGDHVVRMCGVGVAATTISIRSFTAMTVAGGAAG
jgi:hypothetical protein